jgi:HEAT repeat protein
MAIAHAMTPIDSVLTKETIEALFPLDPVAQLAGMAQDDTVDFGVRLRAIRALAQFCPQPGCADQEPHVTLRALLAAEVPGVTDGREILLVRAVIEAIGATRSGDPNDVTRLVPFLDSHSRDLRAATAFALRDLCDPRAIVPLRNRYQVELGTGGVAQVRLAISAALRELGQCQ